MTQLLQNIIFFLMKYQILNEMQVLILKIFKESFSIIPRTKLSGTLRSESRFCIKPKAQMKISKSRSEKANKSLQCSIENQ